MAEELKGSFVIEMALNFLGVYGPDRAKVEAAIPEAQVIVDAINKNMASINAVVALVNQLMPHINKAAPGAQIVVDALAKKQAGQ